MAWILSDRPAPFPWVIEDTARDSEVAMGPVDSGWTHDEEARIARLIASAPDLLEALLRMRDEVREFLPNVCGDALTEAEAAIAKATGK